MASVTINDNKSRVDDSGTSKVSTNNIAFRTAFSPRVRAQHAVCPKIIDTYEKQYDKDGVQSFTKTGEKNIYEEIQLYADDTDINQIITRCIKETGSIDILSADKSQYVDISESPSTLSDVLNIKNRVEAEFRRLPAEVQALFDNNAVKYTQSRLDDTAFSIIDEYAQKIAKAQESNDNNSNNGGDNNG